MVRTVSLRTRPSDPSFYLSSDRYVIFMEPAAVIDRLREQVRDWNVRADKQLLAAIQADVPLSRDTDLRSYGFSDVDLYFRPEFVVAGLLEKGAASAVNVWELPNGTVNSVAIMTLKGMGESRDFCAPNGESIFFITDAIFD